MKKIISIILLLTIVLSLMPQIAIAGDNYSGQCGDNVMYTLDADTGIMNIYGTGEMWDDVVSYNAVCAEYDKHPWYNFREMIKAVIIHDGVTSLGVLSFFQCENLTNITIANSVKQIKAHALQETRVSHIEIPDSVETIGDFAFAGCIKLNEVRIPEGVIHLGNDLFDGCHNLETIWFPSSLKSAGGNGYILCRELENVYYYGDNLAIVDKLSKEYVTFNFAANLKIDGECLISDQPAIIENDRTLVPLRAIFEALGATVTWNGETRTVTSTKDGVTIELTIDSNEMKIGDRVKVLDVPAKIVNSRTLVPVRAISEAFGCLVEWEADTRTVIIETL